jgi:hypothetical protein
MSYKSFKNISSPLQTVRKGDINLEGCILWFDAKDPFYTGVKPASGVYLSKWSDKSGLGHDATANVSILYNYSLNGLPTFIFTESQWLTGAVSNTNTTLSIMVVASASSSTTRNPTYGRPLSLGLEGTTDFNNTKYMNFGRSNGSNSITSTRNSTTINNNATSLDTPYLFECWFDGTTSYNTVQTSDTTTTQTYASTGNFGIQNFTIGQNSDKTGSLGSYYGAISEIIVYNTALNTSARQRLEGYLSWKWGLQGNLPTIHPYYNSPP